MKRMITACVVVSAIVVAGIAIRSWSASATDLAGAPARAPAAAVRAPLDDMKAELAALRASQRQTARLVQTMQQQESPAADEAIQTPPAGSPAGPPSEEEQRAATERMLAQTALLDDTFRRESADPKWSADAVQQLRDRYGSEEFAGVTMNADCKSSMCRVDLQFPAGAVNSNNAQLISRRAPWPGQGFMQVDLETSRATYYLARPDRELPRIDTADVR